MRQIAAIKLSSSDRAVLRAIEHRANESFRDLSRLLCSRESQVRYRFHALQRRGVILEKRPFVDIFVLGFCYYKFYLSFSSEQRDSVQKAIKYLHKSPVVTWLAQAGGSYQLVCAICVRTPFEMYRFTQELGAELSGGLRTMDVFTQVRFSAFGRKYLTPNGPTSTVFETGCHQPRAEVIDSTDALILSALCASDFRTDLEVSRALDIPLSTFRRRVKHLEEIGVIKGYLYRYNLGMAGVHRYCLQISVKRSAVEIGAKLRQFSAQHAQVVNLIELIGPWQFEMTIDVSRPDEVGHLLQELYDAFPGEIAQVESVAILQSHKYTSFSTQVWRGLESSESTTGRNRETEARISVNS